MDMKTIHLLFVKMPFCIFITMPLFLLSSFGSNPRICIAMKKTLTVNADIRNQFDDNINLDKDNEESDWITTISPGILFGLESTRCIMNLNYESGFSYYRNDSSRDSIRHRGSASYDKVLSRNLKVAIRDRLVRSEDPIMVTEQGQLEGIFRERIVYYRNDGESNISWQLKNRCLLNLGYRNRYLNMKSSEFEDSTAHEGFLQLDTFFLPKFGIRFNPKINRGNFKQPEEFDPNREISDDFYQYEGDLVLSYRHQPSKILSARYGLLYQDFDRSDLGDKSGNFRVHRSALGIELILSQETELIVEGGYFVQEFFNDRRNEGGILNLRLTRRKETGTLYFEESSGYNQDYFSPENLGSSEFHQAFGSANFQWSQNLRVFSSITYRWERFYRESDEGNNRKDEVWRADAGFSFLLWQWFTLSLNVRHSERASTDLDAEFKDNRIMITFSGAYSIPF